MRLSLWLVLTAVFATAAAAQTPLPPPPTYEVVGPRRLSGPRVGFTWLSEQTVEVLNETFERCEYTDSGVYECEDVIGVGMPVISQFGWQWERRLFQTESGLTGVTELVALVGGAERGILVPSLTFLVGARLPNGVEFGLGPNVAGVSIGYALSAGVTQDFGEVAVPINVAAVLGPDGPRVSLLLGMVVSDRRY